MTHMTIANQVCEYAFDELQSFQECKNNQDLQIKQLEQNLHVKTATAKDLQLKLQ